ncbi:MAG: NAD(P)-binding domain-containing protein, partial [Kiritimatiellae bacterium]|nr:NAD(P)-binding domain-containing protein [Kiritimatiellia bacterium]
MKNPAIGFIGGGKMAEGILSAIAVKSAVMIGEKLADRAEYLRSRYG